MDRWVTKLDNVDVWIRSQCRTALVYYEWDVGPRPRHWRPHRRQKALAAVEKSNRRPRSVASGALRRTALRDPFGEKRDA
jgi:hypothetical protein